MTLEKLQQKRGVLVQQREQLMANANATSGAIAIIDELIAEEMADRPQRAVESAAVSLAGSKQLPEQQAAPEAVLDDAERAPAE